MSLHLHRRKEVSKAVKAEILHHIKKGRSFEEIMTWLEMPASQLRPIYDELVKQ
jgi:hypothetical protein